MALSSKLSFDRPYFPPKMLPSWSKKWRFLACTCTFLLQGFRLMLSSLPNISVKPWDRKSYNFSWSHQNLYTVYQRAFNWKCILIYHIHVPTLGVWSISPLNIFLDSLFDLSFCFSFDDSQLLLVDYHSYLLCIYEYAKCLPCIVMVESRCIIKVCIWRGCIIPEDIVHLS